MTNSQEKDIVLYVGLIPKNIMEVLEGYGRDVSVMLLRDIKAKKNPLVDVSPDIVEYADFSKPWKIAEALMPYQTRILAVTTHGDAGVNKLYHVIPHLPYLKTPTKESLEWSTNKYEMRKRFRLFDSKITPKFTRVKNTTKKEMARVVDKIAFPLIIKPANLASSLLVSVCYHEEELQKVLRSTFSKVRKIYKENDRAHEPIILAEEFMEGDMYSIDSYVDSRGRVYHCPLVKVIRGSDIGHDDFYNYMHLTPSGLKKTTEESAQVVAETAVKALGLRSTTAHIELIKSDNEWRVIEVGARPGGFRHVIYGLSKGINHTLNDIKVRIFEKPVIPDKVLAHAVTLKWFAKKEGVITEMQGVKKIEELDSFHDIAIHKSVGDRVRFSKNGGTSVFHIFLKNESRSKLMADIRRVETTVDIKVK